MKKYDEYQNYLNQFEKSADKNFRRELLIDCLDDYMDELLDRRNLYEVDSGEYKKLEKRRVEILSCLGLSVKKKDLRTFIRFSEREVLDE